MLFYMTYFVNFFMNYLLNYSAAIVYIYIVYDCSKSIEYHMSIRFHLCIILHVPFLQLLSTTKAPQPAQKYVKYVTSRGLCGLRTSRTCKATSGVTGTTEVRCAMLRPLSLPLERSMGRL